MIGFLLHEMRFQLSLHLRRRHSLVSPREKLILIQIVATWELSFLTSSGYSNAKWKITRFFIFTKVENRLRSTKDLEP